MARFGSADALFGLDGMGADPVRTQEPDSDDEDGGFDLDRDALPEPGLEPKPTPPTSGSSLPAGLPAGLDGMDPKMLEDMMEMFGGMGGGMGGGEMGSGKMPDPATMRRMMQRPEFQEMMAQFGGADLPGMDLPNAGLPGRGGDSRASAQRERLKERLRQRKAGGDFDIPEATYLVPFVFHVTPGRGDSTGPGQTCVTRHPSFCRLSLPACVPAPRSPVLQHLP